MIIYLVEKRRTIVGMPFFFVIIFLYKCCITITYMDNIPKFTAKRFDTQNGLIVS
jgi:hypothetical protein